MALRRQDRRSAGFAHGQPSRPQHDDGDRIRRLKRGVTMAQARADADTLFAASVAEAPRFNTVLLATFAAIAFLTAIVGVYGVLAFAVAQRSAEIGIRMALGATLGAVLAPVMKEGAVLVAAGALAGVARRLWSLISGAASRHAFDHLHRGAA